MQTENSLPFVYPPVSTEIHGRLTSPLPGNVPFTPVWEGMLDNLPEDRDVYLEIYDLKDGLFAYGIPRIDNRFKFPHNLGNRYQGIGKYFKAWLFVPGPGTLIKDGCQEFSPPGERVSPIYSYRRY